MWDQEAGVVEVVEEAVVVAEPSYLRSLGLTLTLYGGKIVRLTDTAARNESPGYIIN